MIKIRHILVTILLVLLILISNAFVFGYSIPLKELPPQLEMESYNPHGHFISKKTINSNDPVYQKLQELLYKNRFGWRVNFISYSSGAYLFRSKPESKSHFSIRCFKDQMIVNVMIAGQYAEFVKYTPNVLQTLGL